MINKKRFYYLFIRIIYTSIDIVCITAAFYFACAIRPITLPFETTFQAIFLGSAHPFKLIFLMWALTILFFNQAYGLYYTRREQLESIEIWKVIKSVSLASFVVIILAYLLKVQDFPRSVLIISIALISFFLSTWRVLKKLFVDYLVARGYNNSNVLIIGAGKVGCMLAQEMRKRPGLGLRVIGFLDDFKVGQPAGGSNVIGRIEDFEEITKKEFISKIFITVHHDSLMFLRLLQEARHLGVAVRVVPQGFEFMAQDFEKFNVGIVPVLAYSDVEIRHRQQGKRLFDIIVSSFLVLTAIPLLLIIASLIKIDSRGSIFYKSRRYGRYGNIFNMYKFRSMVSNADDLLEDLKVKNEVDGPIFKIRNDPRITKLGALLRKYSLDELPQILNVVKGEMSLVGPRPLPVDQVEKQDFQQLKRLEIHPGITGLWQIRGRSDLPFGRLIKWDIWYINNWSFGLDLYILLQTVPVVLRGRGAY